MIPNQYLAILVQPWQIVCVEIQAKLDTETREHGLGSVHEWQKLYHSVQGIQGFIQSRCVVAMQHGVLGLSFAEQKLFYMHLLLHKVKILKIC